MEQSRRDEALSIIGHELRNEVNLLSTWASLLRRQDRGSERQRQAAAAIERSTAIVRRLCDDLTAIALDHDPAFVAVRVDLRDIALAGVGAISADARRKHLQLVQRIDAIPAWVVGDPVRLAQVVSNLLRNALAFTAPGDTITVEVATQGGHARLVVADTGEGISPTFLPHVFEKFAQGLPRQSSGHGLGLYVVRRLVELHKGSVEVESSGRALGARFTVTLASAAADAA